MIKNVYYTLENDRLTFERKTAGASGFDLHANIGTERTVAPGERFVFRCGLYLAMPIGVEAQVRPRSGMTRDSGMVTQLGTIDSDYRGEIAATVINLGQWPMTVLPLDRIAQLVFAPVLVAADQEPTTGIILVRLPHPTDLPPSDRASSGFGSTGR